MSKGNNIINKTIKIFTAINFLTAVILTFGMSSCYASGIYDDNSQVKKTGILALQSTHLNLEKLKKSSLIITPMDDFIEMHKSDPQKEKPVVIFKDYLSAVKIRSIFFEGCKPGNNEIKNRDLVLAHITKAETLKFSFNPETLVLRVNHIECERKARPMIVNDYHLTIQMQIVENYMQGGL